MIDAAGRESIANAALSLVGQHAVADALPRPAAMEPLCDWVGQGKLRAADFITHEFPVERIAEGMEAVRGGEALDVFLHY